MIQYVNCQFCPPRSGICPTVWRNNNCISIIHERYKVGMTNFNTLYTTNTSSEKQAHSDHLLAGLGILVLALKNNRLRLWACTVHTSLFIYTLRIFHGHSSDHLDYLEGLILGSTILFHGNTMFWCSMIRPGGLYSIWRQKAQCPTST